MAPEARRIEEGKGEKEKSESEGERDVFFISAKKMTMFTVLNY